MLQKDIQKLSELCEDYISGKKQFIGKPEEETKQMLIEPLLISLGWPSTHAPEYYDREYRGRTKGVEWKDIALMVDNKPRVFIEAKACTDKYIDEKYAKSLIKYLRDYNSDKSESEWVSWGVLTNFTETFIYHWSESQTTPKPFHKFKYQNILENISSLKETFSPVGVRNNRLLNRYYETPGHKLDEEFLMDVKKWRKILANAFYLRNPTLKIEQISEFSHTFLSRLIFLRRLEAIGVLRPRWVKWQYEAWKEGKTVPTTTLSAYIRIVFDGFWRFYDTDLFQEQACDKFEFDEQFFEELLKDIGSPPERVREVVGIQEPLDKGLYGYNFMELSLDILGTVYEKYLAHTLKFKKISKDRKVVSIEETAKLRQREGAYFTPTHIVKFILNHTLAPQLSAIYETATGMLKDGKMKDAKLKILEIGRVRVLDPACGSGSFLTEAFRLIASTYLQYNKILSEVYRGRKLTEQQPAEYEVDKVGERTLLENLYGVDLDAKAVELTKLNLWLHHIDLNRSSYFYLGGATKRKLLPPLGLNIQCGNSMVCHYDDDGFNVFRQEIEKIKTIRNELRRIRSQISLNLNEKRIEALRNQDEALSDKMNLIIKRINSSLEKSLSPFLSSSEAKQDFEKPFDWQVRFPEVFEDGGFDVYVGNPPYINLYKFSGKFRDYLEKKEPEVFSRKNDILYHFYRLGISLLKEKGLLGYITSRYFLEAENADKLRGLLSKNSEIEIMIDWGNVELFQGINTRCVVITLRKLTDLSRNISNTINVARIKNWEFEHPILTNLIEKHIGTVFEQPPNVAIFHISQSELTDEPWRLLSDKEKRFKNLMEKNAWRLGGEDGLCEMGMGMQTGLDKAFRVTESEIVSENIPREFVRKLVRNGDIRRYAIHDRDEYWIYTNDADIEALAEHHPVKKHLFKFHDKLVQRYPCRTTPENPIPKKKWFQYTVVNIKELFALKEKLIVPYKAPGNRFAMDTERRISSMDVYVLAVKDEHKSHVSIWFILAILNSGLMRYAYITFYGRRKKSEFDYYTGLLEKIPIKKPPKELHDELVALSKEMTTMNQTRIIALEIFRKMVDAELNENSKFEHYYDNPEVYRISNKQTFLKAADGDNFSYEIYHIGVEEKESKLIFEVDFRKDGNNVRQKILEMTINDQAIRQFFLFSVKIFIKRNLKRRILGKDRPLTGILKNILVPRFKRNNQENAAKIQSLMHGFFSKEAKYKSLSNIEKQIVHVAGKIDEMVMELYGLDEIEKQKIRELNEVESISEYFDRLEEYRGLEDM